MKVSLNNNPGLDGALIAGILFWIFVIGAFVTLISIGRTSIPHSNLKIIEASAQRGNLILAHQSGDPIWFANTRCIWIPDISYSSVTESGGSLVLAGKERKQGRVSKLEPDETARLENDILLQAGKVGRLVINDLKSGREIFDQVVWITK